MVGMMLAFSSLWRTVRRFDLSLKVGTLDGQWYALFDEIYLLSSKTIAENWLLISDWSSGGSECQRSTHQILEEHSYSKEGLLSTTLFGESRSRWDRNANVNEVPMWDGFLARVLSPLKLPCRSTAWRRPSIRFWLRQGMLSTSNV